MLHSNRIERKDDEPGSWLANCTKGRPTDVRNILENSHIILQETEKAEELLYVIPGVYCYLTLNYTISVCIYMEDGSGVTRNSSKVSTRFCNVVASKVKVQQKGNLFPTADDMVLLSQLLL